ncbi:MAG: Phosphomannomutase [Planctomycetaceae bacterium]|nr:Phosphomannomutase [Planctomycetaceae bacterium]
MLELPVLQPEPQYVCPGEDYAISRAVHLSRLAAFYPKCRECVHRHDTSQLAVQTVEHIDASNRRAARTTLFTDEGVRGIYLNELTATKAGEIAGAFASLLWEATPLEIRTPDSVANSMSKPQGPQVVIAHDERPSSPDLITGVAKILRRMGCQVIDIGLATRPCFWFAVDHLKAAAGIQVAGSGHDPAWTGLDFVLAGAIPIERDNRLPEIASRLASGYQRPMRFSAGQRTFHCGPLYEASLRKHFHALRPLKVCLGCPSRPVRDVIVRLFEKLACQLIPVTIPTRARKILSSEDIDTQRMQQGVLQYAAHFGLLIDDDGQTCSVFDERGELIPPRQISLLLAEVVLAEVRHSRIVLEQSASAALLRPIDRRDGFVAMSDANRWSIATTMREADAAFAGGDSGRYWFREAIPTCDAVLTLAKLLQALSRSDADFSVVLSRL